MERLGISVKGAVVIARYGGSWRGIKPMVAAEHGGVGCIISSDPRDDGYFEGDVFPDGAFRPRDGVQRGSVMDMPVYAALFCSCSYRSHATTRGFHFRDHLIAAPLKPAL